MTKIILLKMSCIIYWSAVCSSSCYLSTVRESSVWAVCMRSSTWWRSRKMTSCSCIWTRESPARMPARSAGLPCLTCLTASHCPWPQPPDKERPQSSHPECLLTTLLTIRLRLRVGADTSESSITVWLLPANCLSASQQYLPPLNVWWCKTFMKPLTSLTSSLPRHPLSSHWSFAARTDTFRLYSRFLQPFNASGNH